MMGGVCVNTGTIPSKTLREAVVHLTGMSVRDVYGANFRVKQDITMADLSARTTHVVRREAEVVRDQLSATASTCTTAWPASPARTASSSRPPASPPGT